MARACRRLTAPPGTTPNLSSQRLAVSRPAKIQQTPPRAQVPVFSARVLVSLRPSVLDPAGEATRAAASRLGVDGISKLRIGKAVEVELDAPDAQSARQQLELLSDRLLANPVIEDWTLELKDDSNAGA